MARHGRWVSGGSKPYRHGGRIPPGGSCISRPPGMEALQGVVSVGVSKLLAATLRLLACGRKLFDRLAQAVSRACPYVRPLGQSHTRVASTAPVFRTMFCSQRPRSPHPSVPSIISRHVRSNQPLLRAMTANQPRRTVYTQQFLVVWPVGRGSDGWHLCA